MPLTDSRGRGEPMRAADPAAAPPATLRRNFGALSGFLLLHVSVLRLFWLKGRSRRWFVHLLVPLAGIAVVGAVLSGLSPLAMTLGGAWLAAGALYGLALHRSNRDRLVL